MKSNYFKRLSIRQLKPNTIYTTQTALALVFSMVWLGLSIVVLAYIVKWLGLFSLL